MAGAIDSRDPMRLRLALGVGALGLVLFELANVYFIMPLPGSQRLPSLELAYAIYQWRWPVRALCGVLLLFAPNPRAFYASLILVLGLASWLTSNLGGFIIGMLQVLVGGALALSWTTTPRKPRRPRAVATDRTTGIDGG